MKTHYISFIIYENEYPVNDFREKYLKKHELRSSVVKGIVRIEQEIFGAMVDDLKIKTEDENE